MGNTRERFGPVPGSFQALYSSSKFPIPRDIRSAALQAAARLRQRVPAIVTADVLTKLWELAGEWRRDHDPRTNAKGKRQPGDAKRVRIQRQRELRQIRAVLDMYHPEPPPDLWRLVEERARLEQQLKRPSHAPKMPDYYHARVADLRSLGVPRDLIRPLVRPLVRLRGPQRVIPPSKTTT